MFSASLKNEDVSPQSLRRRIPRITRTHRLYSSMAMWAGRALSNRALPMPVVTHSAAPGSLPPLSRPAPGPSPLATSPPQVPS